MISLPQLIVCNDTDFKIFFSDIKLNCGNSKVEIKIKSPNLFLRLATLCCSKLTISLNNRNSIYKK